MKRLPCLADLLRVGQHATDRPAQAAGEVGQPVILVGLGAGDGDAGRIGGDDKDAVALGEGRGNQAGDLGQVQLQRVNAQVGLADLVGQPLAESVQVQELARMFAVFQGADSDLFQRVCGGVGDGMLEDLQGVVGVQVLVGEQGLERA